jgi:thioesterase domain-containing protein
MSDIPLYKLRQQLERGISDRGFEQLGSRDAEKTLIWFGYGGLHPIVEHVGDRYQILYIDCDLSLPRFDGHWPSLSEICAHHLERLDPFKAKSRVIMGGFSFGALVAHESARQLAAKGAVITRAILVDPPPLHHSPWTYFNHGVKRRMFEAIHLWQSLQGGHSRRPQAKGDAARRKAIRRHAIQYLEVLESPVETTLFSSMTLEKEHRRVFDGSKAPFLQRVEIPIRDHIAVITAKEAQSIWLNAFLQDSAV